MLSRLILTFATLITLCILIASCAMREEKSSREATFVYVKRAHGLILSKWIARNPLYQVADDRNCLCDEDIAQMKTGYGHEEWAVPAYHPYYVFGDFNSDGNEDFAVAAVQRESAASFALLVFNGPFSKSGSQEPAFVEYGLDLRHQGLFFGPPRPRPYRLLIGPFESEGAVLEPKGSTYVWSHEDEYSE